MIPRKTTPGISQTAGDARYLEETENLNDLDAKATARANLGTDAAGDARPPTAHAAAHATGQPDALAVTAIGGDAAGTARPASTVNGVAAAAISAGAAAGATASQPGHPHAGTDITSGTVDSARLPAGVTSGAALGATASQPGHAHAGTDITSGTVDSARLPAAVTSGAAAGATASQPGHSHAPGEVTGTAVVTADARLPPAPALGDALKVPRVNAAGDAYEAGIVPGSAAEEDVGTAIGDVPQLVSLGGGIAGYPGVRGDLITVDGATTLATIKGTAEDAVQPPAALYDVPGGLLHYDAESGTWITGILDPCTGAAVDPIWTQVAGAGQAITPLGAGAAYRFTETTGAGPTDHAYLKRVVSVGKWEVWAFVQFGTTNDSNVVGIGIEDASDSTVISRVYLLVSAGPTYAIHANEKGGDSAGVASGNGRWIGAIFDQRTRVLATWQSTNAKGSPPYDPDWTAGNSRTLSAANSPCALKISIFAGDGGHNHDSQCDIGPIYARRIG